MSGKNVDVKMEKGKMVITIDTTKEVGPSASGKTTVIGTTGGAIDVDGMMVNLTVYKKK
jgi:ABC-type multidrug transport system fused ATPase/permease subunit